MSSLKNEDKQREFFRNILLELSKNQNALEKKEDFDKIIEELEFLYYRHKFRHYYSDIFSVLTMIKADDSIGNIDILGQNMEIIKNKYKYDKSRKSGDISPEIRKLYDHVSLDIARLNYSDAGDRKISMDAKFLQLQGAFSEVEAKAVRLDDKIENSQKEYISILGIFAAVVLAFTGGIAFSTSVLNNINKSNVYRITIVSLVIGLILVNVLFGLFYYINSIVKQNTSLKPLIISNAVIFLLMLIFFIGWNSGISEKRDLRIKKEIAVTSSAVTVSPSDK